MSSRVAAAGELTYDIAVIGAGPAGLAAATTAATHGRRVLLIDAARQIGGQYWRHLEEGSASGPEPTGHRDWAAFLRLRARLHHHLRTGAVNYLPETQVWFLEAPVSEDAAWSLQLAGTSAVHQPAVPVARAMRLILCPGAYDRQLPVPGWDLPGVMAAGGVQALLKGHRTLAGRRAVVAGTGPFLLPVAEQLAHAGATVVAICEANHVAGWGRHLTAVVSAPAKLLEAASYATSLARAHIPYRTGVAVVRIDPDASGMQVGAVQLARVDRHGRPTAGLGSVDVDLVALGWGFTPALELVTATGAATDIDVDRSLVAVVDELQRSTVAGVHVAGEATGIGGAQLAVAEGELAGIVAAGAQELRAGRVRGLQRRITRMRAFAAAMHHVHPLPSEWFSWLTPETVVCRCEEVTVAAVRNACDELGARDARTVKLLTRTGMGWCQGHVCGLAVATLAAAAGRRELGAADLRPLAKQCPCTPVSLALLASDPQPGSASECRSQEAC